VTTGWAIRAGLVVLAATAAGCAQAAQAPRASGVVPWVDRPAPPYAAPAPRPVPYPASAPACRAGQVRATGAVPAAAGGNVLEAIRFTNRSRTTCLLAGFPAITAVGPRGVRVALRPRRAPGGTFFGPLVPADVVPGRYVELGLAGETVTCRLSHPRIYRDLDFTLPRGGVVRSQARVWRLCGGWEMTSFGLPRRTTADIAPRPGSLGFLHVVLDARRTARAETTLRFVITLVNPGLVPVRLRPCPSYTEAVYASGAPAGHLSRSLFLNCDQIHTIGPGGRVRYAMRVPLPRAAGEQAKLAWHLNIPAEPATAAPLMLRPSA
jgi:uncharacterized protein DUF4232